MREEHPYFPERLLSELNLLGDKDLNIHEIVRRIDLNLYSSRTPITSDNWLGISGMVAIEDPLNRYAYVLGFADGTRGLLRKKVGVAFKRGSRVWVEVTEWEGVYEPLGIYDDHGNRIE